MTFHKIFVDSNEKYAVVTISANNLVLWQKFKTSEEKNPQNLLKDGYMNNSWGIYSTFPSILSEF